MGNIGPHINHGTGVDEGVAMIWDNAQALQEGWDLFDLGGRLVLQRIDCPSDNPNLGYDKPKFQSDAHAIVEVATKARAGSRYHWNALHLIGTEAA